MLQNETPLGNANGDPWLLKNPMLHRQKLLVGVTFADATRGLNVHIGQHVCVLLGPVVCGSRLLIQQVDFNISRREG